ncbi:hypothetical protein IC582_015951 [Cucumis melo]|uniref:Zinc finger CCHC domain-containing protein n=2 Tax=Cucumis melo TaxID=3656 RepID=A0A5A7UAI9_CUCMM|nr:putative zinc finger CCHC domain-containing protein [Cucumis melo var. makuwa]TYK01801.1 putative zinc finger CCHC domain-containing protein [Cucumis melo var. makuwa]
MDGEEGGGIRLSKRFSDKAGSGEVDYKTKAGTAWSHSYLNQKPWHPLSYPNQRRKWIAEQTHSQREKRAEEVAREYAQEQEFFRQTALVSKKEKEKLEMMKAVSFMYVRPPGYNAESAKAAEIADDRKKQEGDNPSQDLPIDSSANERPPESSSTVSREPGKKPRPKDVFGRALPTEEEFEVLKNAPRMDTGVFARVKPFGVEVRNVKCVRCGIFGHQSGDRECPLKDAIMPNEESRLKRDDPLTTILANAETSEPLKWELKQKPGISPPRGGFNPDDPNQQIVAEDIFDEYGGFLSSGGIVPELLSNFSSKPKKKKVSRQSSRKKFQSSSSRKEKDLEDDERISKKKRKSKRKKQVNSESSSETSESDRRDRRIKHKISHLSDDSDSKTHHKTKKHRRKHLNTSDVSETSESNNDRRNKHKISYLSDDSDSKTHRRTKKHRREQLNTSDVSNFEWPHIADRYCPEPSPPDISGSERHDKGRKRKDFYSYKRLDSELEHKSGRKNQSHSSEDSGFERHPLSDKTRSKHSSSKGLHLDSHHSSSKTRPRKSYSSDDSESNRQRRSKGWKNYYSSDDSDKEKRDRVKKRRH